MTAANNIFNKAVHPERARVLPQQVQQGINIGTWDYVKELLANRVYHCFEAVQLSCEWVGKGLGLAGSALSPIYTGLGKLVATENIVFFASDLLTFPAQIKKLSGKAHEWKEGNATADAVNNQARKVLAHVASTVSDYAGSCRALAELGVKLGSFDFIKEKFAHVASSFSALSGIYDYCTDPEEASSSKLGVDDKKPFIESKKLWGLAKNVSILGLSVLSLSFGGIAALPGAIVLSFSSAILVSRMFGYYRELQVQAIDKVLIADQLNKGKIKQ